MDPWTDDAGWRPGRRDPTGSGRPNMSLQAIEAYDNSVLVSHKMPYITKELPLCAETWYPSLSQMATQSSTDGQQSVWYTQSAAAATAPCSETSGTVLEDMCFDPRTTSNPPAHAERAGAAVSSASRALVDGDCPVSPRFNFDSPFKGCLDNFSQHGRPRFTRPSDGQLNSYVKFRWHEPLYLRRQSSTSSTSDPSSASFTSTISFMPRQETTASSLTISSPNLRPIFCDTNDATPPTCKSDCVGYAVPSHSSLSGHAPLPPHLSLEQMKIPSPRLLPPHFGFMSKMDGMDRKLWSFYVNNWCPGRTVLEKTNLWLKDFAQMHCKDGVRSAIQSLAGIYVYDYCPSDSVHLRIKERFYEAETRFGYLLNDHASLEVDQGRELVTMAILLSMFDPAFQVVLTEHRLIKPFHPRWLRGMRQAEAFLRVTDPADVVDNQENIQLDSLRVSQCIMVGRAVILAETMLPLPSMSEFQPEQEVERFSWLLHGTRLSGLEIHGGCGFCRRLLHLISQITYCAARLKQEPESLVVPVTGEYLFEELINMTQWSSDSADLAFSVPVYPTMA
ncbi:hypothetical protein PCL_09574 [Purpureocillium lilacinum]|uniref:Uncharacterized protein n=1 Tax=Purpureocillium lilacinum TaxID=33203 RepID=A0A2U3DQL2_PURLI|nr:hypothetical protein PCL_09574 [Purpureocillium lilacinum]